MDGPRAPSETEIPNVIRFLDTNLRPKGDWSITSEYPIAFSEANRNNIRIITENEEVLAHAVVRPMILKTPAGLFKVAGLGSVVTSTDRRNEGLSTKTIESCLEGARAHGCDFAILWTNLYEFYRRIGFELAGNELSVLLDREMPVGETGLKFLESGKIAPEAIHRLYSQHTVTSLRTVEETRKYLQIPNSRVYTAWDAHGVLKAYAIEGKGADLDGYIHEWGGGVQALISLFAHIRTAQKRNITVIVPGHSQNLVRAFTERGFQINEGFLGMIKILNVQNLFSKVKRHARALGVQDLVLDYQGGKYYLGVGASVFMTDSERDVVRLIFGPQKPSEIHDFGPDVSPIMERVLPISMWVWGWDSV
jgi:predicted acetyltransferase